MVFSPYSGRLAAISRILSSPPVRKIPTMPLDRDLVAVGDPPAVEGPVKDTAPLSLRVFESFIAALSFMSLCPLFCLLYLSGTSVNSSFENTNDSERVDLPAV